MEDYCKNCKKNCCSNSFKGLSKSLKDSNDNMEDFVQILLSKEEATRIIDSGNIKYIQLINGNYFLRLNEDNSCFAFQNGKCLIYNVRPNVCRLYPYYFDPFAGICVDKNCPGNFHLNDIETNLTNYELIQKRLNLLKKIELKKQEELPKKD